MRAAKKPPRWEDQTEFSVDVIFRPGASLHEDPAGRNIFFGVREFAMCAAVNGMAADGGLLRLNLLLLRRLLQTGHPPGCSHGGHSLFVFTHNSLGPGQDGPTHQQPKKEAPPKRTRQH